MLYDVIAAEPRGDFKVWVRFENGVEGEADLSDLAGRGVFKRWTENPSEFGQVKSGLREWHSDLARRVGCSPRPTLCGRGASNGWGGSKLELWYGRPSDNIRVAPTPLSRLRRTPARERDGPQEAWRNDRWTVPRSDVVARRRRNSRNVSRNRVGGADV